MTTPSSFSIARADELYRQRALPGTVEESLSLLADPDRESESFEIEWRRSRALFFLGQQAQDPDKKIKQHAAAVRAARRAVSLNPAGVEGHFWLGVNLSLFAEASGGLRGALALLHARRSLKTAARISESYHGAGPLRVLGRLDHRAPRLLGGNPRRGLGLFERAMALSENSVTLIYTAELLVELGERRRARSLLERLLDLPSDPDWEFENGRDRKLARSMLDELRIGDPAE